MCPAAHCLRQRLKLLSSLSLGLQRTQELVTVAQTFDFAELSTQSPMSPSSSFMHWSLLGGATVH